MPDPEHSEKTLAMDDVRSMQARFNFIIFFLTKTYQIFAHCVEYFKLEFFLRNIIFIFISKLDWFWNNNRFYGMTDLIVIITLMGNVRSNDGTMNESEKKLIITMELKVYTAYVVYNNNKKKTFSHAI